MLVNETAFWARVDRGDPLRCWPWKLSKTPAGYGQLSSRGRQLYAHRVAYELATGPIPKGLVIDHLCRNRACCNPSHLEPVSNAENILRGESPAAANARKERCPKGHEFTPQTDGTRRCDVCRRERRIARGEISGRGHVGERTHCPAGHPYDEENTYFAKGPDGSVKCRMCRECMRQRNRARRAREREARTAA